MKCVGWLALCVLVASTVWFALDAEYYRRLHVESVKVYFARLAFEPHGMPTVHREFCKARYYFLLGTAPRSKLHPGFLRDFGPIDPTALQGLGYAKGGSSPSEDYEAAKRMILRRTSNQ